MKINDLRDSGGNFFANPRLLDRLIAACTLMLAGGLLTLGYAMTLPNQGPTSSGTVISIESPADQPAEVLIVDAAQQLR